MRKSWTLRIASVSAAGATMVPIRHPVTWERVAAWHWDLRGDRLVRALDLAEHRLPPR